MLLRNCTRVIERVLVDLYFDDSSEKHIELAEKDIIKIDFNDNGFRRVIEGKVIRIVNKVPKPGYRFQPNAEGYITVDGSGIYAGNCENIYFSTILDCEMIEKYDENLIVKTVSNGVVNRIRINEDGILQISRDGGLTYINVADVLTAKVEVEDAPVVNL